MITDYNEDDQPLNFNQFQNKKKHDNEVNYNENKINEQKKTIEELMNTNEMILNTWEKQEIQNDQIHKKMIKEIKVLNDNKLINPKKSKNNNELSFSSEENYSSEDDSKSYNTERKYNNQYNNYKTKSNNNFNNKNSQNNDMFQILLMLNLMNKKEKTKKSKVTDILEKQNNLLKDKIKQKEAYLYQKPRLINQVNNPNFKKLKKLECKIKGIYNIKNDYNKKLNKIYSYQNKCMKNLKQYARNNLKNNNLNNVKKYKPPPIFVPFPVRNHN